MDLTLKWDNHHPTVIAVFEDLLEKGTLVDCTIAAEGQYLKAHKVVLAACSPYFKLLFAQEQEKNPIVVLKDVKFQELKQLIDFVYRGQVNLKKYELDAFLVAAESLQVQGLSTGQTQKTPEKTASKTVPCEDGRTSPVPRKRRRSCPSVPDEECQTTVPSPNSDTPRNDSGCNNNAQENLPTVVDGCAAVDVPSTSAASCAAEFAPCSLTSQQDGGVSDANVSSQNTLSPEEVLPDIPSVVKTEPEDPEPLAQVFCPEPKNEEYVDELALLESEDGAQDDTSQQSTNDYPGFSSYDSSGDAFLMNQMTDGNASPGANTNGAPTDHPPAGLASRQMATGRSFYLLPTAAAATTTAATAATTSPATVTFATSANSTSMDNRSIRYATRANSQANRLLPAQFTSVAPRLSQVQNSPNQQLLSSVESALSPTVQMSQGNPVVQSLMLTGQQPPIQAQPPTIHKCSECNKAFCTLAEVKAHRLTHSGGQEYKCQLCGEVYKGQEQLKLHYRVHAEARPYRCDTCDSSFTHKHSLITHRRIHEDYRYRCNACQKTFGRSGDLLIHKRLVCLSRVSPG